MKSQYHVSFKMDINILLDAAVCPGQPPDYATGRQQVPVAR